MTCPFCHVKISNPPPENDMVWEMNEGEWVPYPCPNCGQKFKLFQDWVVKFRAVKPKKKDDMRDLIYKEDYPNKDKPARPGSSHD